MPSLITLHRLFRRVPFVREWSGKSLAELSLQIFASPFRKIRRQYDYLVPEPGVASDARKTFLQVPLAVVSRNDQAYHEALGGSYVLLRYLLLSERSWAR